MTPAESPAAGENKPLDAEIRKDLKKYLALAFPLLVIGIILDLLKGKFVNQPGLALWIIVPGVVISCLIFLKTTTRTHLKLGWPFLIFLFVYIVMFFIAAETRLLDWKRSLSGYEKAIPGNFLALNRFGDWHYKFASEVPDQKLAIVLMNHPASIEQGRLDIATLIDFAATSEARGVALDFAFDDISSDNAESDAKAKTLDQYICKTIADAKALRLKNDSHEWPVLVAYDFQETEDGHTDRNAIDPRLQDGCLPIEAQGHGADYVEWDGKVRSIPVYLDEVPTPNESVRYESLSLKIAKTFDPQIQGPGNGLLQFVKPQIDFKPIIWEDWEKANVDDPAKLPDFAAKLKGRFIIVGERSQQDSFPTPYGVQPGAVIHGYAVHSLRQNHFIKRSDWWVTLLMISLMCYLMMVLTSLGIANVKLILINAGFSIIMVGISVLVMYVWLIWIDLVYPLLATWLFLFLLIAMRSIGTRMAQAAFG